ncbi:MAG: hypothetical protein M3P50_07575, partial [Actinomycetota bacterium]|nr:hypothetical protein [Actinomycetota bacterium]
GGERDDEPARPGSPDAPSSGGGGGRAEDVPGLPGVPDVQLPPAVEELLDKTLPNGTPDLPGKSDSGLLDFLLGP